MLKAVGTPSAATLALHPGYLAGRGYLMMEGQPSNAAIAAVDTLYFYPFRVFSTLAFVSARYRVATGGAGSSIKAGIWANSIVSQKPLGAPLFADNTGVATATSTTTVTLVMSGTLAPGIYWVGVKATGTLPTMRAQADTNNFVSFLCGAPNGGADAPHVTTGFSIADAYANNLPTIAEGATFTTLLNVAIPALVLST